MSPQRRPPTSSINGPLLPGLAVHIVGIAEGWAVEGKKGNSITLVVELKLMMLYLYSSRNNIICYYNNIIFQRNFQRNFKEILFIDLFIYFAGKE